MYNRERYFPTLQDYRTYAEKLFSETSNVKNILIEGMHYTRFLLYLTVLYEEIFQEDCDLSKNYRAWYANLLRWHFFGWRIHTVHCPVRLHYRKWRCLNEIFIETLSVDRKCFFYTINGVSEYFSVSSMFFYIH
ncbi:hypothetical protein WMS_00137 [Enterococcus faecalis EnGen0336]|uniref:hypothetical protein n=1 Tax=Enterococcus faecalis TaxID=1351 RepID=UPI00032FB4F0|nr:hypothetical protein [Enterococcus faecalis]EOJ66717.1 hypothetical protein WMS_00137 [Enterococcus faecalis EnGen0336]MDN3135480.1 hypothetical protein [Enterococcus faecalis]NSU70440.1 hypothetical protein [Enterococcus faecalis]RBS14625.1 hypothetical protein EA94_02402 [Enterococcus faecalis]